MLSRCLAAVAASGRREKDVSAGRSYQRSISKLRSLPEFKSFKVSGVSIPMLFVFSDSPGRENPGSPSPRNPKL